MHTERFESAVLIDAFNFAERFTGAAVAAVERAADDNGGRSQEGSVLAAAAEAPGGVAMGGGIAGEEEEEKEAAEEAEEAEVVAVGGVVGAFAPTAVGASKPKAAAKGGGGGMFTWLCRSNTGFRREGRRRSAVVRGTDADGAAREDGLEGGGVSVVDGETLGVDADGEGERAGAADFREGVAGGTVEGERAGIGDDTGEGQGGKRSVVKSHLFSPAEMSGDIEQLQAVPSLTDCFFFFFLRNANSQQRSKNDVKRERILS